MKSKHLRIILSVLFVGLILDVIPEVRASGTIETYDARIGNKEILTPAPCPGPRINGPKVCGVRPGRKFVYRIPCQGKRPVHFQVENLPAGLKLDAKKGIITGVTPSEKGDYPMDFTAQNKHGKESRSFKLIVGDKLGLTPPTGWNSWGGHMVDVSDTVMRKAADIFVEKGLADVGFQYVGIDDCWMRTSPEMHANRSKQTIKKHASFDYKGVIGDVRDADGNIIPNAKFPGYESHDGLHPQLWLEGRTLQ